MYLEDINSVFCKREKGGHHCMMNVWGILRFISDLISRRAGAILSNLFDLTTDLTRVCAVGWFRHGYDPFTSDKIASTHCF